MSFLSGPLQNLQGPDRNQRRSGRRSSSISGRGEPFAEGSAIRVELVELVAGSVERERGSKVFPKAKANWENSRQAISQQKVHKGGQMTVITFPVRPLDCSLAAFVTESGVCPT